MDFLFKEEVINYHHGYGTHRRRRGHLTRDPSAAREALEVRNRDPVGNFSSVLLSAIFFGRDGLIDEMSIAVSQL